MTRKRSMRSGPGSCASGAGLMSRLRARLAAGLALVVAAFGLVACGPGLGGTGTGATQEALAAYGAREAPVCEAEFAGLLGCPPAGAGAAPLPATGPRFFAEASPASRALLELSGQEAQLHLRCLGVDFVGAFGQAGNAAPRYYGHLFASGSPAVLAALTVQRSGTGLALVLVDAAGSTLFGPQVLEPVAGVTTAAVCP